MREDRVGKKVGVKFDELGMGKGSFGRRLGG